MHSKRILASVLVSMILISNTTVVQAEELVSTELMEETVVEEVESETNEDEADIGIIDTVSGNEIAIQMNSEELEEEINSSLINVDTLDTQLIDLYKIVSDNLNINVKYIEELHAIAGGNAVYADKKPNIYADKTIETLTEPLKIDGADTKYRVAEFIDCLDDKIERPSAYYLPDAIYSVSYDINSLMNSRYNYDRGGVQIYFDALNEEVKADITFYEALLLYTGEKEDTVNEFFKAYEKMLYDKQSNENVIENIDGTATIKDKFLGILTDIGITDNTRLKYLATALSFDSNLAINDSIENVKDEYVLPYKVNYTSRENMMIAAACLDGKVRYVWGGGHSGASYIDGINPVWERWNSSYPSEASSEIVLDDGTTKTVTNEGYATCIKPSGSWCPIHGHSGGSNCSKAERIKSLDDYIQLRAETFDTTELLSDKYTYMMNKVDYSDGISVHTLDGLDCSGFASWLYNQITDRYEINSTAENFVDQYGLEPLSFGSDLLPGDVFAWSEHIVIIVGKVKDNSKAYVTIEQTPNVLKYGVVYYSSASSADIKLAEQIATEANILIGGLTSESEKPHAYCMDTRGYQTETTVSTVQEEREYSYTEDVPESEWQYDENGELIEDSTYRLVQGTSTEEVEIESSVARQTHELGRFKDQFIDDNICVGEADKPIKDMTAQEIIQYTLTKLPISYVSGYNLYVGDLFNKNLVSSNLGVTLPIEEE